MCPSMKLRVWTVFSKDPLESAVFTLPCIIESFRTIRTSKELQEVGLITELQINISNGSQRPAKSREILRMI